MAWENIFFDALKRIQLMSQESGIYAIDVDVINKGAKSFYKKYGFEAFQDNDRSMVITMKTVQRLLKTY